MLSKLVPDIQRTAELVQEISAASREQDTGAEQINQALQQLEKVIQHNASTAEEMSAATEELSSQAENLVSALSFFRTGDEGMEHRPAAPVRAPQPAAAARRPAKEAHGAAAKKSAKKPREGFALKMAESHDAGDDGFERY
jgi:methyl-accepting chemotaxis protein